MAGKGPAQAELKPDYRGAQLGCAAGIAGGRQRGETATRPGSPRAWMLLAAASDTDWLFPPGTAAV